MKIVFNEFICKNCNFAYSTWCMNHDGPMFPYVDTCKHFSNGWRAGWDAYDQTT